MIPVLVGAVVILLIGGAGLVLSQSLGSVAEQRLDGLSGPARPAKADPASGILMRPPAIDLGTASLLAKVLPNVESLNRLYEQADVNLPFNRFLWAVGVLAALGAVAPVVLGPSPLLAPVGA